MSGDALYRQQGETGDGGDSGELPVPQRRGRRLLAVALVVLAVVGAWAGWRSWSGHVSDGHEHLVAVDTVEVVPDGDRMSMSYAARCAIQPGIRCRSEVSYSTPGGDIEPAALADAAAAGDPVTVTIKWYRADLRTNGQRLADAASREVFVVQPYQPWPLTLLDVRVLALVAVGWTTLQALVLRGVPGRRWVVTAVGTVMVATCAWVALNTGHNMTSYEVTTWWDTFRDALWWLGPLPVVVAVTGIAAAACASANRRGEV